MAEEGQAPNGISLIQSMLNRLKVNERVQRSALHISLHNSLSKDMDESECELIQQPGNLECLSAEQGHSEISVSPDHSEIVLRNDTEDPSYFKLGTDKSQQSTPPLIIFSKWERRKQGVQSSVSPPMCGNVRQEPAPEVGTSQDESHYNTPKGSSVQQQHGPLIHSLKDSLSPTSVSSIIKGTTVSKEHELKLGPKPFPPPKPPRPNLKSKGCNLNFAWKETDEVEELLNKDSHMAKKDLDGSVFFETHENTTSKSTQSVSDAENSRIDGSLSDQPRKSNMYFRQAQATPEQEAALLAMDYNSTSSKMQKQVTSEEETEPPANPPPEPQHSPLPSPKEESPTTVQVSFQRTFTLQDFTLTLEPINLLEEVLIGEEWSRFLPVKSGPPQGEANNQSQMEKTINVLEEALIGENCASFLPVKDRPIVIENDYSQRVNTSHFSKDSQSQNLVITQDKSTDKEQSVSSQSEKGQVSTDDSHLDRVSQEKHRQREKDSCFFAFPKVLIINSGIKHKKPEVPENEHLMDDHEYAVVDVLIQPNSKQNKRNSKDFLQLDLSAVKSRGVLDNSALKSRIYLSKKRKHRPPKLRRKGKAEAAQNFKTIDSLSDSTTSSPLEFTRTSAVFASSIFYSLPHSSLFPDSEVSLTPALGDKQKAKERGRKAKIWNLKA